ncbi:hypothetical protein GCM10027169_37530 [Gordonia jinhuaensis]|uniref:Uncharacterized protein n=1 Tax=Gordonia jinhuaensis TaxID=1517702 RepID=A0A916WSN0_9ACTN|nr:hypothetical protein [Gordonia jinhuaensis]GGB26169.1 hypothetical protein GCM10011489_12900 [Gordonia jinhuaensis]
MWWKVALAIVVVWLLFGVLAAAIKGIAAIVLLILAAIGTITVVRWFTGSGSKSGNHTSGNHTRY